jgi:hypothetical protein
MGDKQASSLWKFCSLNSTLNMQKVQYHLLSEGV